MENTPIVCDYNSYCEARYMIDNITSPTKDDGNKLANLMMNTDDITCMYIFTSLQNNAKFLLVVHRLVCMHMVEIATTKQYIFDSSKTMDEIAKDFKDKYEQFLFTKRFLNSNRVLSALEADEGEG